MFKKFFGGNKDSASRALNHPRDLQAQDMITLKPFAPLPQELQGATLTVKKVQTYQYSDGIAAEFVLEDSKGGVYTMTCSDEEDEDEITFSSKLPGPDAEAIFGDEALASLWEEGRAVLVPEQVEKGPGTWFAERYVQSMQEGVAFFYRQDKRKTGVSQYEDDDSEELRYHECEGEPDCYGFSVEIWGDGSTDFFLQVSVPLSLIEEMWPNG